MDSPSAEVGMLLEPSGLEISGLWSRWENLVEIANEYKLLRFSPAEVDRMRVNLRKLVLRMNPT